MPAVLTSLSDSPPGANATAPGTIGWGWTGAATGTTGTVDTVGGDNGVKAGSDAAAGPAAAPSALAGCSDSGKIA
jgi:hypothetical protein